MPRDKKPDTPRRPFAVLDDDGSIIGWGRTIEEARDMAFNVLVYNSGYFRRIADTLPVHQISPELHKVLFDGEDEPQYVTTHEYTANGIVIVLDVPGPDLAAPVPET